ncbi:MAG: hypothetical protein LC799_23435, partial [Actinobacteria bacterium]|nr:hypothetical protein [Actinomycetota bacterium]
MNHKSLAKLQTPGKHLFSTPGARGGGGRRSFRLFVAIVAAIAASAVGSPAAVAQTSSRITSAPPPDGIAGNGYL